MLLTNNKEEKLIGATLIKPFESDINVYFAEEAIAVLQGFRYQECNTEADIKKALLLTQFEGFQYGYYVPVIRYDELNKTYRRVKEDEPEYTDIHHNLLLLVPPENTVAQTDIKIDNFLSELNQKYLTVTFTELNLVTGQSKINLFKYNNAGFFDSKSELYTLLNEADYWTYITADRVPDILLEALNNPNMPYSAKDVANPSFIALKAYLFETCQITDINTLFTIESDMDDRNFKPLFDKHTYKINGITGAKARLVGWTDRQKDYRIISDFIKSLDIDPIEHDYGFDETVKQEDDLKAKVRYSPELFKYFLEESFNLDMSQYY